MTCVWRNGIERSLVIQKVAGFESMLVRLQVTALGKLLTRMCPCHQAVQFGTGDGR